MPGIQVDLSESSHLGSKSVQDLTSENDCHETIILHAQQSHGEGMDTNKSTDKQLLDKGYLEYGCTHYQRRCRIRAPCCNEIFDCRHCHNESKNNLDLDDDDGHSIPRHQVLQVICSLCNTEQKVQQVCINCGVCMGKYFCGTCRLFDDDTSKEKFHCVDCGICRVGGQERYFHCNKCQGCFLINSKEAHPCFEGAIRRDCPICFEYLFESTSSVLIMPCGHAIHRGCFWDMQKKFRFSCPLCSKTVNDMSELWKIYDMKIAATPMPLDFQNKTIKILCNDCSSISVVQFHFVGHKCPDCKSYNTRET